MASGTLTRATAAGHGSPWAARSRHAVALSERIVGYTGSHHWRLKQPVRRDWYRVPAISQVLVLLGDPLMLLNTEFAPRRLKTSRIGVSCLWVLVALAGLVASARCFAGTAEAAADGPRTRTPLVEWQFVEDVSGDGIGRDHATKNGRLEAGHRAACFSPIGTARRHGRVVSPDHSSGDEADRGQSFYLMLEGAASVKDVFVNGQHIGQHKGAFSRCSFDLTPALQIRRGQHARRAGEQPRERGAELLLAFHALLRERRHVSPGLAGENRRGACLSRHGIERNLSDAEEHHRDERRSRRARGDQEYAFETSRRHGPLFCERSEGSRPAASSQSSRPIAAGETATIEASEKSPTRSFGIWPSRISTPCARR